MESIDRGVSGEDDEYWRCWEPEWGMAVITGAVITRRIRAKRFERLWRTWRLSGFRMFLNARCRLVDWSSNSSSNGSSGNTPTTNDNSTSNMNSNSSSSHESVTLAIEDLSLADFVELPEKYTNSLSYCEVVCGVVEGALESVNARERCTLLKTD